MAITNLYSNLPGHLVEFKDGGLSMRGDTTTSTTKSILIIGTAFDGPINEPVAVDIDSIAKVYGEDYTINSAGNQVANQATLVRYARQAYKCGFDDIRCMRVTGTQASASFKAKTTTSTTVNEGDAGTITTQNSTVAITFEDENTDGVISGSTKILDTYAITVTGQGVLTSGVLVDSKYDPIKLRVPAGKIYSPKSTATCVIKYAYVNDTAESAAVTSTVSAAAALGGGDVITMTIPANSMALAYTYSVVDGITTVTDLNNTYSAGKDENGVAIENPVLITLVDGTQSWISLKCEVQDSSGSYVDVSTISGATYTMNADGTLTVSFESAATGDYKADSADATKLDSPKAEIKVYLTDATGALQSGSTTVSTDLDLSSYFSPLTKTVETAAGDAIDVANGDTIRLYNGTTKIAQYGDGTGVITYNPTTKTATFDLSKVSSTISSTLISGGQNLSIKYTYTESTVEEQTITFRSTYGGTVYNDASVAVEKYTGIDGLDHMKVTLNKPSSKWYSSNESALTYTSEVYPTFGDLKTAVESTTISPLNNVFEIVTDYDDALLEDIDLTDGGGTVLQIALTGGTSGVGPTNDEYFEALSGVRNSQGYLEQQGAYQILENYSVDYIYVAGIYSDSEVSSSVSVIPQPFHYELALLCAVLTYRTKMTHGFIDVKPITSTNLTAISNWVTHLKSLSNEFVIRDTDGSIVYDDDQNAMDIGWYTSCVVGPQVYVTSSTLGGYYASPAIAYAALTASLGTSSSPTNKKIPGCTAMRFKLSNKQMDDITGNRMICFKYKGEGTSNATTYPYAVDGCTCGLSDSDYTRISTVKVVTEVVDQIRDVADPFLGEPNTTEQRNALSALISKRLSKLKENSVISYYDFTITATNYQVLLGEASITLTLQAPQELRKITTTVALQAQS